MGIHYRHLGAEERGTIMAMILGGASMRCVAEAIGRSPSTVQRELRRNGYRQESESLKGRPRKIPRYDAPSAGRRASRLRRKPRVERKLVRTGALWPEVVDRLHRGWSPEQIAGRLGGVSHETIYTAIYATPRGQLRRELTSLLRQGHRTGRKRRQGRDRRGRLVDMVSIHVRPPEAEDRLVPGHWEGDFIVGRRNQSAVGTLVDRHSLFVMLAKMDGCTAEAALEGFSKTFNALPEAQRRTLTYDQGKEMARHSELAERTGLSIYFADPNSPWQRGINENTNGLLRQYLPKGHVLSNYTQRELDAIAWQLNNRPRKSLGFRTPAEVFFEAAYATTQH
nr:IS30 family transposase [Algiphilus aromaticivorans]